jgi:polyisoprenoid-binding protein YceI
MRERSGDLSGVPIPVRPDKLPVGDWAVDQQHSRLGFIAKHLVMTKIKGRFTSFSGTIHVGETLEDVHAHGVAIAESINTGDLVRDSHLRSRQVLDVESHPTLEMRVSDPVYQPDPLAVHDFLAQAQLTIKGITMPVSLGIREVFLKVEQPPVLSLRAEAEVNRKDFGLLWPSLLEIKGVIVSEEIQLDLRIEATRTEP